jgi:SNF2 family DNA or RNA helicase
MLLRLRQLCCHPSLIQEGGLPFILSGEMEGKDHEPVELSTELSRARRLVSQEFVATMKEKFKQAALARIAAEKEVCAPHLHSLYFLNTGLR